MSSIKMIDLIKLLLLLQKCLVQAFCISYVSAFYAFVNVKNIPICLEICKKKFLCNLRKCILLWLYILSVFYIVSKFDSYLEFQIRKHVAISFVLHEINKDNLFLYKSFGSRNSRLYFNLVMSQDFFLVIHADLKVLFLFKDFKSVDLFLLKIKAKF